MHLVATVNRSNLVIVDIDCTIDLSNQSPAEEETTEPQKQQEKKVMLSGLLNFVDGLWSSIGDEHIIIFTTNHKEKLDPALLRLGRMDLHVNMSYCTPSGFRVLASNYLGAKEHNLFGVIEDLIRETEVTPTEVAEELMKSDKALCDVIEFLRAKQMGEVKVK
ncbi:hypothetical protein MLD38_029602 [Melastoma candidum]|uniref:Uncharacterized protein n=1 Tax=Melastoma candidum TaxID=119954 RepID=A0ACB9N6C6_9MYRT|nr:hypothetical protein MLD38_029602 [Melastoma candidum]